VAEKKIISIYAKGLNTRDIQAQVNEPDEHDIAPETVSWITDSILEKAKDWQRGTVYIILATCYDVLESDTDFGHNVWWRNRMLSLRDGKIVLGWREWLSLPDLKIPAIKAKVDTGARSSALHAFQLETHKDNGRHMVRFALHPLQKRTDIAVICTAEIIDYRRVSDSGGHHEMRYVIMTPVCVGNSMWNIEITLTDRESMQFRMLLGRTGMEGKTVVDPEASYLTGRKLRHAYGRKLKKGR